MAGTARKEGDTGLLAVEDTWPTGRTDVVNWG